MVNENTFKRRIKFDEDSELWVKMVVGEIVDTYGNNVLQTQWVRCKDDWSLGSMKKPPEHKIVAFEYRDTSNPFKKMFKD